MESGNTRDLNLIRQMLDYRMRETYTGSDESYTLWFSRMQLRSLGEDKAVFACENEMKQQIISDKFLGFISDSLADCIGYEIDCEITVDTSLAPVIPNDGTIISPLDIIREKEERQAKRVMAELESDDDYDDYDEQGGEYDSVELPPDHGERRLRYNDEYTFDNFVVGNSNEFAYAAALNVANNVLSKVSTSSNPLFIWGPSGLGKTHLMYAIANRVMERDTSKRVIYVKGEEFTNQIIEAIMNGKTKEFRTKYRRADVLLIDDIQFIAGKESTQSEFFHTFEALYENKKQIIITSDRPPKELTSLLDRIRSRFEAGLLADIQPPDYELRLAILRDKIHKSQLDVSIDVVNFLAKNLQENIRQLEGVVKKLAMSNMLTGAEVNMDMVINTVPEYLRDSEPVTDTVDRIIECVAKKFGVTVVEIKGTQKKQNIKDARNVAMKLIQDETELSLSQIGAVFGRDHSTVHSNINRVRSDMASDPVFEAKVEEIIKEIKRKA